VDQSWGGRQSPKDEPFFKLLWIVQGEGIIYGVDGEQKLSPHRIYFSNGFKVHEYLCPRKMRLFYLHFLPDDPILLKMLKNEPMTKEWAPSSIDPHQDFLAIEKFYNMDYQQRFYYGKPSSINQPMILAQMQIQKFLLNVTQHIFSGPFDVMDLSNPHTQRIKNSIEYMDEHYGSMPSLEEVASQSELSPEYFVSLFKKAYDNTPHQYMLDKRLKKATQLLKSTNLKVKEVALECGYKDVFHFSKTFKKFIGVSPKNFSVENKQYLEESST
jgi:AraC-like DNA-binding protein